MSTRNMVGVPRGHYVDDKRPKRQEANNDGRTVHAIQINLRSPETISVIIRPFENREFCLRLINSKRTWMTDRSGEAVLLRRDKSPKSDRNFVDSISLLGAFPVEIDGAIVETAQAWLDGSG